MNHPDYDEPLDADALGWICRLAAMGKITPEQFDEVVGRALAKW